MLGETGMIHTNVILCSTLLQCVHYFTCQILGCVKTILLGMQSGDEDFKTPIKPFLNLSTTINQYFQSPHRVYTNTYINFKLIIGVYMLGRTKSPLTYTGLSSWSDVTIMVCISGGAEAVNAMKGTAVKALNPPILSKSAWKFVLLTNFFFQIGVCTMYVDLLIAKGASDFPPPVGIWTNTSLPCTTGRRASSCPCQNCCIWSAFVF